MPDKEKVIKGLEFCQYSSRSYCDECPYAYEGLVGIENCTADLSCDALSLLEEQDTILQKMWNALYAEEGKLESKYVGTDEHDKWFLVYRPWLLLGFGIAINVISKQEERSGEDECHT